MTLNTSNVADVGELTWLVTVLIQFCGW